MAELRFVQLRVTGTVVHGVRWFRRLRTEGGVLNTSRVALLGAGRYRDYGSDLDRAGPLVRILRVFG